MVGVKELISELCKPFDRNAKAIKKAKKNISDRGENPRDKELLNEEVELILAEWDRKRQRGEDMQRKLCEKELKTNPDNTILGEYIPHEEGNVYTKEECKLENNKTYLEKKLVSHKYGVIGYADKIEIKRNTINITDNKVVDKIYRTSKIKADNGYKLPPQQMLAPLNHLEDTNYIHFCLQLSLYMYMTWENNKNLKIGKLFIRHIVMNDKDKITSDEIIEVPYMKEDVIKLLKYKKLNDE